MTPIGPFGWVDNTPPDIDTANLELDRSQIGAYADAQIAARAVLGTAGSGLTPDDLTTTFAGTTKVRRPPIADATVYDLRAFYSGSSQPADMLGHIQDGLARSALTGGSLLVPDSVEPWIVSGPIVPPYNSRMVGPGPARFSEMGGSTVSHGSAWYQLPVLPNAIGVAWIRLANGVNGPILTNDYNNSLGFRGPQRGTSNRYVQRFNATGIVFDHNGMNQAGALRAIDIRSAWSMNFDYCHLVNPRGLGWSYDNCDECNSEKLGAGGGLENIAFGTGTTSNGSPTITAATSAWNVGDLIVGTNIPAGAFLSAVSGSAGNLTLTLASTVDGSAVNATASASGVALSKSTMISTALLSLSNTTVDCQHEAISMHATQNGVVIDGAYANRVSGLTGFAMGGYNLWLRDTASTTTGCRMNHLDLRLDQATMHNARFDAGAKSNYTILNAFNCGMNNTPADSDGGWANVFDDGKANVTHGTAGRAGGFAPTNLPLHVFGPNAAMGQDYIGGGDALSAGTILYRWRPADGTAPGAVRSCRHAALPPPFVIPARALVGTEGTTLTYSMLTSTYHEVAVFPDSVTTSVVAYFTIPPGANAFRVQIACVNLTIANSGNVQTQLAYGDTTEFGTNTPGQWEGGAVLLTKAVAASAAEFAPSWGPDGGSVVQPGVIQCGQQSWIAFKRIGADAADTLSASIGVRSILITPELLAT